MKRYLCLYLPHWPLQRLHQTCLETRGAAVALFEASAHGPRIVERSGEAERLGVRVGMSGADARALEPGLLLYEVDRAACRQALDDLALWAGRFSPKTGVESLSPGAPHPQALWLDITGCERVFRGEENIVRQAVAGLRKQDLRARAAIAPTLGSAWALAHFGTEETTLVSGPPGPAGWVSEANKKPLSDHGTDEDVDPPTDAPLSRNALNVASCSLRSPTRAALRVGHSPLRFALAPLPIAALRIEHDALRQLAQLGLERIGELLQQPRATLPSRFGANVLERIDQALGDAPELMPLLRPAPQYHVARAFDFPLRNSELLFKLVEDMTAQLAAELNAAARGARQIECWLYHELAQPVGVSACLYKGSASAKHLWKLLHVRLDDFFRTPHAALLRRQGVPNKHGGRLSIEAEEGVCAVALHVLASEPLGSGQLPLFDARAEAGFDASENLALLLDRLVSRLGAGAVLRVRAEEDALPERAYRTSTLEEPRPPQAAAPADSAARPLRVLPQPIPVSVEFPSRLRWRNRTVALRAVTGPERIESGWWRDEPARRDYYVAEAASGTRYWLFQRLDDARWFLHGLFE
jgi:protein ImuB